MPVAGTSGVGEARYDLSPLTDADLHLFNEGAHYQLYDRLGAQLLAPAGEVGAHFAVWAPAADGVWVSGDFNGWSADTHPLRPRGSSGVWEAFVPGVGVGALYKYLVRSRLTGETVEKSDPLAFAQEIPPATASAVTDLAYEWGDDEWMERRRSRNAHQAPIAIYEVHLGSWRRVAAEGNRSLSYRELAVELVEYVAEMGFTHVELLPVMEHPFYGSWGYQTTGYFAPTSRYGTPHELMELIDRLHQAGIGVILDWVPSHFPTDAHSLGLFDGTHLYEHADPRQGIHPDWGSYIFNYGRREVQAFLISSACFWLDRYHADGLRLDAVASMLYLDYSRKDGEWIPNRYGGRENLEAIDLLRRLNSAVYQRFPGVQTYAEESTAWPGVTRPVDAGGLGFGFKWDMGWMHDTLRYLARDPAHRAHHHRELTFRMLYAFSESYLLPLSHDEVVYGKGSLLARMPGDAWQRLANLRLLLALQYTQPGKKLLFMGAELAQEGEWRHDGALEWALLQRDEHRGVQRLVADCNRLYRQQPALHQLDCEAAGFAWLDADDAGSSVIGFLRRAANGAAVVVAANLTPVPRRDYRVGVPRPGAWRELLNTDAEPYGGSGLGNLGGVASEPTPAHGCEHSLVLTLPPLAVVVLGPGQVER